MILALPETFSGCRVKILNAMLVVLIRKDLIIKTRSWLCPWGVIEANIEIKGSR